MNKAKQILVLDDDPHAAAKLGELIRLYGFQVDCADSCQVARQMILAKAYDGLVLDLWMEDGTSRDLLSWLRAAGRKEPVVMVSETADYDQWIELVNQGAADLLAKPVVPSQLERALQLAVGVECAAESDRQRIGV